VNVVVIGRYPPSPDRRAWSTVDVVRDLAREGHDVTVVSPERSAAHASITLAGARGALALARSLRGADRAVICDATLLDGIPARLRALALRRAPAVDMRDIPPAAAVDELIADAPALEPWPTDTDVSADAVMAVVVARAAADRVSGDHAVPAPQPTITAMVLHTGKEIVRRSLGRYADRVIIPINRVRAKAAVARQRARRGARPAPRRPAG